MLLLLAVVTLLATPIAGDSCESYSHPQYGRTGRCVRTSNCPNAVYVSNLCQSHPADVKCCFSAGPTTGTGTCPNIVSRASWGARAATNSFSNVPYNYAPINTATIYKRPKQSGPNLVGHWGIVVNVEGHGDYLIHNTLESGTVVTPVDHMSSLWTRVADIPVVNNGKTIRGALRASGGAHTNYISSALARYVMGATCVGTTAAIGDYLITASVFDYL